jgi:Helix-turn-helix domain
MPIQLALQFDDVPVTCEVQRRYHLLAPVLAGRRSVAEQAQAFNLGYSTVARWLHQFRAQGMPGLFPGEDYTRGGPYTPERVIVTLLYFRCCAPKASARELARVVGSQTESVRTGGTDVQS